MSGVFGLLGGWTRTKGVGGKMGSNMHRRGSLTPKRMPKDWYKGYGAHSTGRFRRGSSHYIIDPDKLWKFRVPDLTGFELKPYVSIHTPKVDEPALFYSEEHRKILSLEKMKKLEMEKDKPRKEAFWKQKKQ